MEQAVQSSLEVNKSTTTNTLLICFLLCYNNMTLQLILHFSTSQPNARKEDLFGRPSQGLYSSSYTASKGLAEATLDRSCLEVNMGSSQVYITHCPPWQHTSPALIRLSCILPLSLIPSINMHPFLIPPLPCFLERITGLTWLDWWKQCNLESLLTPIHVRSVISTSWKEKEEGEMHQIIGAGPRSSQYISILKQKHSL